MNGQRRATRVKWALAIALTALLAAAVVPLSLAGGSNRPSSLSRLKHVTGAYHNPRLAFAGGFERDDFCVESPQGGMGFHYGNPARLDLVVDRDKPEFLLYAPAPGGERRLTGVEYMKIDADQNLETDDDRPRLFGRRFKGPMPGHGPGMPIHYDLHVWLWKDNPRGTFADWNPRVDCP